MNNEIKEILDKLKDNIPVEEYRSEGTSDGLTHYEEDEDSWQYKLYNYITNLQESDKEWSMIFDTFSKRPYAHKYLEQKKKELGNENIICLDSEMIYKDYYNLQEEIERQSKAQVILDNQIAEMSEYKSRNEKAIEYIKWNLEANEEVIEYFNFDANFNKVLDILQGSDK